MCSVKLRKPSETSKNGPFGGRNGGPEMARLLAQASPSAQGKAAAAQVGDRNRNWRKNLSCPTIRVKLSKFSDIFFKVK